MVTLLDLNKKLNPPNKRTNPESVPTYQDVLIDSLEFTKPKSGKDSIAMHRLAQKLFDAGERLDLENAEFEKLKDVVNGNPSSYFTWVHAQVMEYLDKSS